MYDGTAADLRMVGVTFHQSSVIVANLYLALITAQWVSQSPAFRNVKSLQEFYMTLRYNEVSCPFDLWILRPIKRVTCKNVCFFGWASVHRLPKTQIPWLSLFWHMLLRKARGQAKLESQFASRSYLSKNSNVSFCSSHCRHFFIT